MHDDNQLKDVLLIAYYFPPAGGPAAQRILQFVKNLPAYGWRPTVLTVGEGAFPDSDRSLLEKVPETIDVHRTRSWDPFAWYSRLVSRDMEEKEDVPAGSLGESSRSFLERAARWVRANIFIPDARVGWWPFAVNEGKHLLASGRFEAILSTGAPHSVHLIGRSLHRSTGVPWLADLHDPWTDISYYDEFPHTRLARSIDTGLERSVLREASTVTTVSPSWKRLFEEKGASRCVVVENGFSNEAFEGSPAPPEDEFIFSYVGRLYASRNPIIVWDALEQLRQEREIPDLRVRLIGTVDASVRRHVADRGLEDCVEYAGFVPHEEALRAVMQSRLLMLVIEEFEQADGMITSKLYEYIASERPVLGIGPPEGDAAALLAATGVGRMFGWNGSRVSLARFIREHYRAWEEGHPIEGALREDLQSHTWQAQTGRLAEALDRLSDDK